MRLKHDIGVALASSLWSAAITLASVPAFIHYLGIEAYGLIGFFATTQALLQLLDMGLSPTINREVARCMAAGTPASAANLVHSVGRIYWGVAVVIAATTYLMAGPIADQWLQSRLLPKATIERSVILLGLVIACRWPIGLYQGVLLGSLRVGVAGSISMLMVALSNGGALLMLAYVSATVEAFFLWQAGVGLLYTSVVRHAAWRALQPTTAPHFDAAELTRVWRFAVGMVGIAFSAILLMQTDKLILSRLLPLADFGRYAMAGVVASGLYLLLTPTFNVIYPRMSALVAKHDENGLANFYRTGSRLLSAVLFPMAATAASYSLELLTLWTQNAELAASASTVATLFLIGTALNGAMHFPYALQLACGLTRLPLTINAILVTIMVPLTIGLANRFGAIGGAMAWALLNFLYLLIGTWLTHRTLLRGLGVRWLLSDIAVPAILSALMIGLSSLAIRTVGLSSIVTLLLGIGVALVCSLGLLWMSHRTRVVIRSLWSPTSG